MTENNTSEVDFTIDEEDLPQSDSTQNDVAFEITNADMISAHLDKEGKVLEIDNGLYKIELQLAQLRESLTQALSVETADKILGQLLEYASHVASERAAGRHLGSSEPVLSLRNIFYDNDGLVKPDEYGLQTETELKLIMELVAAHAEEIDN